MKDEDITKYTDIMEKILQESMVVGALSFCVENKDGQITDIRMERNPAYDDWASELGFFERSSDDDSKDSF